MSHYFSKAIHFLIKRDDQRAVMPRLSAYESLGRMISYDHQDAEKLALTSWLKHCTVDDRVYVWVSGMDCDCTSCGHVDEAPCTYDDFVAWRDHELNWADGPMSITVLTPDIRDLALEAFEDGHQHIVYP